MIEVLSYAVEFIVEAACLMAALWVMIKVQKLNYSFLGLLVSAALGAALDMIPYFGHYLAVPVLFFSLYRVTRAEMFPDVAFTVVVAYALTFCMNLFLLGAFIGDLRPSAREEPEEITTPAMSGADQTAELPSAPSNQVAVVQSNPVPVVSQKAAVPIKAATTAKLSEATLKSIKLKGLNSGARPSAILSDGKRTFTLNVGESRSLTTADGLVTVKLERVTSDRAAISLNGEQLTLSMW